MAVETDNNVFNNANLYCVFVKGIQGNKKERKKILNTGKHNQFFPPTL